MKQNHNHGDHHHHDGHSHISGSNRRQVALAAALTGIFMIVELVGGLWSGSLALIADAGHMLTDFAALSCAWGAFALAARPATDRLTYGYDRYTVLAAFVNALALIGIAIWILIAAARRFSQPGEVLAGPMLWVAMAGLLVNLLALRILKNADNENLNIRGAMLHVLGDLLGSVGAILAALIIMATGWTPIDPILSVLVSFLILSSAVRLLKDSTHILIEGAPYGLDRKKIISDLMQHTQDIDEISHVHIWCVTPARPILSLHVRAKEGSNLFRLRRNIVERLNTHFHIDHVTLDMTTLSNETKN